jgi:hypothetical protein
VNAETDVLLSVEGAVCKNLPALAVESVKIMLLEGLEGLLLVVFGISVGSLAPHHQYHVSTLGGRMALKS